MKKTVLLSWVGFVSFTFFSAVSLQAQRPIRGTVFYERPTSDNSGQSNEQPEGLLIKNRRFADTITIAERGEKVSKTSTKRIEVEVDEAMKLFDNQEYSAAQERFRQLSGTISANDPLLMEVLFMTAECDAVLAHYSDAEKQLVKLTTRNDITPAVLEKALVRLGHVFCAEQKLKEAEQAFKRLRQEFPESKYTKLADCSAIK